MSASVTTLSGSQSIQDAQLLNQSTHPTGIAGMGSVNAYTMPSADQQSRASATASALPTGVVRRKPARRANTAERRATHNAVERQRRETLNGRFLDLAALLPNLVSVRRPSKSAIVNSSIALIHTQRRQRALAARELRLLSAETDALRREVNEWRAAHPNSPVVASAEDSAAAGAPIDEPTRSADFLALMELEDPTDDMEMTESERIAYEMRGGESASYGDDGEEAEYGDDDYADGISRPAEPQETKPLANQHPLPPHQTLPPPPSTTQVANRARGQSFAGRTQHQQQQGVSPQHQQQQQQQAPQLSPAAIAAAHASLVPSGPFHPSSAHHQQLSQHPVYSQAGLYQAAAPFGLSPTFDALTAAAAAAAAAAYPQGSLGDVDPAKLAAWNAHIYATLANQQQQQQQQQHLNHQQQQQQQHHLHQQQQHWAAAMQFQVPPTAHSMFGVGATGGIGLHPHQQSQQQALLAHLQRAAGLPGLMYSNGPMPGEDDMHSSASEGSASPMRPPYSDGATFMNAGGSPGPSGGSVSGASVASSPSISTTASTNAPSLSLSVSTQHSNGSNSSLASPLHLDFPPYGSMGGGWATTGQTSSGSPATTPGVGVVSGGGAGGARGGNPSYVAMSMLF